jgi:hypothetical protein
MMLRIHLPYPIYHLPLISHFSFDQWQMTDAKLLRIDNCKLIITSEGGL